MNLLILDVRSDCEDDPPPARMLAAFVDIGKAGRFLDALDNRQLPWHLICMLEEDMLAFASQNRWCWDPAEWEIVVGICPELESLPEYTGWDDYAAWVRNGDWVFIFPDSTDERDFDDVRIYSADEFAERYEPVPIASAAFADDSGIQLNARFREILALERQVRL